MVRSSVSRRAPKALLAVALVSSLIPSVTGTEPAGASVVTPAPVIRVGAGLNSEGYYDGPRSGLQSACVKDFGHKCNTVYMVEKAYALGPIYKSGSLGGGQTIAILGDVTIPTLASDVEQFDTTFGLPSIPSLTTVAPFGSPSFDKSSPVQVRDARQQTVAVEWAHALAPGANIVELVSGTPSGTGSALGVHLNAVAKALAYAINHNVASIISMGEAQPEQNWPASGVQTINTAMAAAFSNSITVLAATGDQGVFGRNANGAFYSKPVVAFPASNPLVTAVGGSDVELDDNGVRLTNDTSYSSFDSKGHFLAASGGGVSAGFPAPPWQSDTSPTRALPDLSMLASPPTYAYATAAGGFTFAGGTALGTPVLAGVLAVVQSMGNRLGLLNAFLYSSTASAGLIDITTGPGGSAGRNGGTRCLDAMCQSSITVSGFATGTGYDRVSGIGTLNLKALTHG